MLPVVRLCYLYIRLQRHGVVLVAVGLVEEPLESVFGGLGVGGEAGLQRLNVLQAKAEMHVHISNQTTYQSNPGRILFVFNFLSNFFRPP